MSGGTHIGNSIFFNTGWHRVNALAYLRWGDNLYSCLATFWNLSQNGLSQ